MRHRSNTPHRDRQARRQQTPALNRQEQALAESIAARLLAWSERGNHPLDVVLRRLAASYPYGMDRPALVAMRLLVRVDVERRALAKDGAR